MRIPVVLLTATAAFSLVVAPGRGSAQSLAPGAPSESFAFTTFASGLGQVTDFRFLPDGSLVAISRTGEVRLRRTDGTVVNAGSFAVNSGPNEQGLLGVEVHPSFATNRQLIFYYSAAASAGGTALDRHRVVTRVLKDDDTLETTESVLVRNLRGPANHNGGSLQIGTDGKLYIGVGDTGCNKSPDPPNPPGNYFGTCLTNGNGKILRVNLDGTIPTDNPLVGVAAVTKCGDTCGAAPTGTAAPRTDIWAWGFRNPWRFWIDPKTGKLWVGDVGEADYEEIDIAEKGRHHGWPWREGLHGWPVTKCTETVPNTGNCYEPVHELKHSADSVASITGGQIVDSCDWPDAFRGLYFFGDNVKGSLWTLQPNAARDGVVAGSQKDFGNVNAPVAIHSGPDGALYVASLGQGKIIRFAPKTPITCPEPPDAGPDAEPTDASTDDAGVTDAASDASTDDAGTANPAETSDDGGCGCALPGRSVATRHGWLALAIAGAAVATRRRRRR